MKAHFVAGSMKTKEKMIISKTVCDVPDQNGRKLFGRMVCGEPAIAVGPILISVMYGKEAWHVCMKHAQLPLAEILKQFRREEEIGLVDDTQR